MVAEVNGASELEMAEKPNEVPANTAKVSVIQGNFCLHCSINGTSKPTLSRI